MQLFHIKINSRILETYAEREYDILCNSYCSVPSSYVLGIDHDFAGIMVTLKLKYLRENLLFLFFNMKVKLLSLMILPGVI